MARTVHFEYGGHELAIENAHPDRLGRIFRPAECPLLRAPARVQAEWTEAFCAAHPHLVMPVPWQTDKRGVTRVLQVYGNGAHARWRHVADRLIAVRDKDCLVSYAWRADLTAHPGVLVRADIYMHGRMRVEWKWNPLSNTHTPLKGRGMGLATDASRAAVKEFARLVARGIANVQANAATAQALRAELDG